MSSNLLKRAARITALAAAAFAGYGMIHHDALPLATAVAAPIDPAAAPAPAPAPAAPSVASAGVRPDFAEIVRRYGPAVVNVSTVGMTTPAGAALPDGVDPGDPLAEWFRRFAGPQQRVPVRGVGSGFVIDTDGVVLTNAHVVLGAKQVRVKFSDGRELAAKVVGVDRPSDVAVLRVDAKGLPVVRIGDPSRTQVGEWVLAIGSPYGFDNSATAGIVSAKARALPDEGYVPFLQTDVAVNPGNSGGPLFNSAGEVIGINSQIYSSSGGYQGLSFAIPIDVALKTERQLLAHGKVTRGRLGVVVQDVNATLAAAFHLERPAGALVSTVEEGSGAARAGVQPGDIILEVNGSAVAHSSDLPPLVADLAPGSRARLQVWRDGSRRQIDVAVGEAPGAAVASAPDRSGAGRVGMAVRELRPGEREGAESGAVVVESVDGPAARAGIQPGDVLVAVDGTRVSSVAQLQELLRAAGKDIALLVRRDRARLFVPIEIG